MKQPKGLATSLRPWQQGAVLRGPSATKATQSPPW